MLLPLMTPMYVLGLLLGRAFCDKPIWAQEGAADIVTINHIAHWGAYIMETERHVEIDTRTLC